MRDPVSHRATLYGVAIGFVDGALVFGAAIVAPPRSSAQAHNGAAFILSAVLLELGNVALLVSLVLLLQLGYAICRRGEHMGIGVGAGIQAGFLAGAVWGLGSVLGLFVVPATHPPDRLLFPMIVFSLATVLLVALVGAGLGAGLAAIGAALGQRRYRKAHGT